IWIPHTHMITAVAVSRLSLDQIEISKCGWSTSLRAAYEDGPDLALYHVELGGFRAALNATLLGKPPAFGSHRT
ncbi:hypothetical protein AB0K67_39815, partial [Nonomuraea sp. NPDC052634]|uniref:hypothetical protein n=1 Tax=Nonomuraea sp. NPDC052634 TaxID=3155813 RepID=UPI003421681E